MDTVDAAGAVQFGILGPLEVRDGDRVLALGGAKQRAVLVLLLLRAGEVVSLERLVDELWGERSPATAAATLQVYVSRLRKALPEGMLLTEGRGYRLAARPEQIDARRFQRLVEEGSSARAQGDGNRAARLLREALELWRGPALVDFEYESFAQAEIARLEELRVAALEERVDADLACGRAAELVGELEALIAAHPLRERLRGQLMLALYRSGRQAEALQAYQEARRALVDELGIEPSPALRELEGAVLAQDPALGGAVLMGPAPARAPAEPTLPPATATHRAAKPEVAEATSPARKVVTILFSDVAASSTLAAEMDPEWLERVMGRLFETATEVVVRHGGTIEKFIGDAVMAVFGVPRVHEDDAARALRAALDLRDALGALNDQLERDWGVRIGLHTGINTGEVMTGDPTLGRLVTGDAVVVATRLQDIAKPGEIVVGERTAAAAGGAFEFGEPVEVAMKGRAAPVTVRRVLRALSWERPRGLPMAPRVVVGRGAELGLLENVFERVHSGEETHLAVILGESGIGKTTLVSALRERLGEGVQWHVGRCAAYGEAVAYRPLAEILRGWLGIDESEAEDVVLDQLGDRRVLGLTLGLDLGLGSRPDEARRELIAAWVELLGDLAADGPAVVVVEDLHWADEMLLELLQGATRQVSGPLLIMVTARPELVDRAPQWTSGAANVSQLRLEPLKREEASEMLTQLSGSLPDSLRALLLDRAEGNPFFLEEALASLAERGVHAGADVPLPDSVHGIIAARIDLLDQAEKEALGAAAVIGRAFWQGAVEALLEGTTFDLSLLEQRGFVRRRRQSSLVGQRELWFKHALTREVAYGSLPRALRARLHAGAGEWLERAGADAGQLAHHYGRAYELAAEGRESPQLRAQLAERSFHHRVCAAGRALRSADPQSATVLLADDRDLRELSAPELDTVAEAGRLLVALGRFGDAVGLLDGFVEADHPVILRELGIATCKLHRDDRRGADYRRGQGHLERAATAGDADAIASLAGTWKGIDDAKVRALYARAAEIDRADPYPLGSLLEIEIEAAGDLSPVEAMRERISAAIERCRRQVAARENLPWAHYDLGKLTLLLGEPYDSLQEYAKAVDLSPAAFMVATSLASLERLAGMRDRIPGLAWAHDLLQLALRAKFAPPSIPDSEEPFVILAGGTASDDATSGYAAALAEAFRGLTGTIISGGTVHGVSGLVGELGECHAGSLRTLGYLPQSLPAGAEADGRYHELRRTPADDFSPLEPLRYWDDLLAAGIRPARVRAIGIGGGRLAAAEYAIALALGGTLGIISGSGRAADDLLADPHWCSSRRLTPLAPDADLVRAFMRAGHG